MTRADQVNLFKIRLYFLHFNPVAPFPTLAVSFLQTQTGTQLFSCNNRFLFFQPSSAHLLKSLFFLLFSLKLKLFRVNFSFSRFSTKKNRVSDHRFNPPKLTEFSHNIEGPRVLMVGLQRTKVAVNYFVNSINFYYHFFQKFSRQFFFKKLQPFEKLSTLFFKKAFAHRFGFSSYCTSFFADFSFKFFWLNRLLYLSYFVSGTLITKLLVLPVFNKFNLLNISPSFFFVLNRLTMLAPATGLVVFVRPNVDLFNATETDREPMVGVVPVRHFDAFYPFTKQESRLPGSPSVIPKAQVGRTTFFFFNTKRMLKRRFKVSNLFPTVFSERVFPYAPPLICSVVFNKLSLLTFKHLLTRIH